MKPLWTKTHWTLDQLDHKTVQFSLPTNKGIESGIGEFWVRKNPDGLVSIEIVTERQGKTPYERVQTRYYPNQNAVDRIAKHSDQSIAEYQLLYDTPSDQIRFALTSPQDEPPRQLDSQEAVKYLEAKWGGDRACPMCASTEWSVSTAIFQIPETIKISGSYRYCPVIPVSCKNCGFTALLNSLIVQQNIESSRQKPQAEEQLK